MTNHVKKEYTIEQTATSIYFAIKDVVKELQELNVNLQSLIASKENNLADENAPLF